MLARLAGTLAIAIGMGMSLSTTLGIEIQFDYRFDRSGFFDDPAARSTLEAAADTFDVLLDNLAPISPGGINRWDAVFFHPSTADIINPCAPASLNLENLTVPANTVTVFVGARDLCNNQLGEGGPGGFSGSGTQSWLDTLFGRGQGGQSAVQGPFAIEFGPWGGSLAFDTLLPNGQPREWHFDITTDPARNTTDLFSVAVHELGHLLGFGSADSFDALIDDGAFEGPQAMSLNNGETIPLHVDNSHWAPETTSPPWDADAPIAAMDPTITSFNGFAMRREFTPLDYAALDDLGWTVDPSVYVVPPVSIDGDYNDNSIVEQGDLDLVLLNWGEAAGSVPPTWVNDLPTGLVDQEELDGVLLNWGNAAAFAAPQTAAVGGAAVPEPATSFILLTVCGAYVLRQTAARFNLQR